MLFQCLPYKNSSRLTTRVGVIWLYEYTAASLNGSTLFEELGKKVGLQHSFDKSRNRSYMNAGAEGHVAHFTGERGPQVDVR